MAFNHLMGFFVAVIFGLHCVLYGEVHADGVIGENTFTISSFSYPQTRLNPYDWRYVRVNLPPWFSSMSITIESDVNTDLKNVGKASKSTLPIICFREGSPPLPDVYNTSLTGLVFNSVSNATFGGIKGLQIAEQCFPLQKIISVRLTNEQISPGVWYLGLFNGIGSMRTQSKMINRGRSFSFKGNVSVEGCIASSVSGQFCNETVNLLTCAADSHNLTRGSFDNHTSTDMAKNAVVCRNANEGSCQSDNRPKIFSLNLFGFSELVMIKISNITFSQPKSSNSSINASGIIFTYYARHGAIPLDTLHDYSGNISEAPLIISTPKAGLWYIIIQPVNLPVGELCYSLQWQVLQCPVDKAGPNCTWNNYMLQTVVRKSGAAFESYYLPLSMKMYSDSANFPVEPLLSNSSYEGSNNNAWTFFLVDVPFGAAGGNMHIHLASEDKLNYEIYTRYGGFPSLDNWDYFCNNSTSRSNGSMFFKMYDSGDKSISFYILYAREGTWGFGLKHLASAGSESVSQTTMTISIESCPQKCSSPHGACKSASDTSGLTLYSYCACDRNHGGFDCSIELVSRKECACDRNDGGFDCSIELVSRKGHLWQSVSLIASNAAAVLPAYWALRHKAFAEWVLFTSSGISSGLYHACDVGTWCPLTFHVLQFMDFWLSFMAVVSTFVYLAAIDETSKRTIHTVVAIVTALMAETGPTRSSNIALVLAIGTSGLVIGWFIELSTHSRSISRSWSWTWIFELHLNMPDRLLALKNWTRNLIKTLLKRFRWGFVVAGFIALAMAGVSWTLETSQSYWIWHSMWHVSIYTSSFFFLCSKAAVVSCHDEALSDRTYALTRQNSMPRDEQRDVR